jgi:hypothetical protein
MYMDKESFLANFEEMDIDGDKALTFEECRTFFQKNAKKYGSDSVWQTILNFGPCLMMAHKWAASRNDSDSSAFARKTVDVTEMKALFIHCYVFCILYEHFALGNMDDPYLFKKKLNPTEFQIACDSLNALHSHEICDERALKEDFVLVDTNYSGQLGFITVGIFVLLNESVYVQITPLSFTFYIVICVMFDRSVWPPRSTLTAIS